MDIIKDYLPESKFGLKCPYDMVPEFVVIHNTANDASAKAEISYMKNNAAATSFHFAVDDLEVRQAVSLDRNVWHAGDGECGTGNRKGIAIEICYSRSGGEKFLKAEENAAKLVATFLTKYGWGIDKVKKHWDFSGKYCPHRTLDLGWGRFLKKVESYMEIKDVEEIVQELSKQGIITDKELWLEKLEEDLDSYWLARKCTNFIRGIR